MKDKAEFEPRIRRARERLVQLQADAATERLRKASEQDFRELLTQLEEFSQQVREGLQDADASTRREIIRSLVKRIEVDDSEVRVVYRVNPFPVAGSSGQNGSHFQDRVRRPSATSSR